MAPGLWVLELQRDPAGRHPSGFSCCAHNPAVREARTHLEPGRQWISPCGGSSVFWPLNREDGCVS